MGRKRQKLRSDADDRASVYAGYQRRGKNYGGYVYLLSRMEPQEHENKEKRAAYRSFSRKMYEWSGKEQDRKELITAIYLYVYLNRKREEQD